MNAKDRRARILEDAWVGDAVLALYARLRILREDGRVDSDRFIRMTSNRFLSSVREASEVEAEICVIYRARGLDAAFDWIEQNLMPRFLLQEQKRRRGRD